MKNWNAEVEQDITDIADGYYADGCPYWEFVIAVQEWARKAEESGAALFGSKEAYVFEMQQIRRQIEEAQRSEADERSQGNETVA